MLGTIFKKDNSKVVSLLLSFAGGVMLSIVCFELIHEAILMYKSKLPAVAMLFGFLLGIVLVSI